MAFKLFDLLKRGSTQPVTSPAEDDHLAQAALAQKSGDLEGAVRIYDTLIARQSGLAEAHYKRANALNGLGRWEQALAGYERAVELRPDYANAYCNRGTVLERLRRWDDALQSYDRAIALAPGDYFAHYNRGSVLKELLRLDEALASYERALSLKGDYAEAYINRGHVLQELGRREAAIASYDKGIQLNPHYAEAFLARANSLAFLGHHEAAVASYDKGIELKPDYAEAILARAISLSALNRHEAAKASFDQVLRLDPERKFVPGLRRTEQMHICDWSGLTAELETLAQAIEAGRAVCPPFATLTLFDSPSLHRLAGESWIKEECPPDHRLGDIVKRNRGEKIKIGYFSADFREHPVARLTAGLFETHDRSKFEITAFAFGPEARDAMRSRLESAFDRFIDVRGQSDVEVARLAREIGIDVAVDLGGLTQYCRTKIFALRAAPIQLSYIGYLGTMSAPYMDYLLADEAIVPAERRADYFEKIIWLPSYQVNDSQRRIGERQFTRAELGLPAAGFVFCCLNAPYKIMPNTFAAWMRILQRVPSSVLFLYANNLAVEANLRDAARLAGVDPDRIVFGKRVAVEDYLARYQAMDLFLDTLPYNAGTTASDALWAGLPLLTCKGQSFAARYGASLLNAVGMPELITNTLSEYEELAVQLASDAARMGMLRQKLANNRAGAQLFDTPRFTRNLESAYVRIYERYLEGLPPDHIS